MILKIIKMMIPFSCFFLVADRISYSIRLHGMTMIALKDVSDNPWYFSMNNTDLMVGLAAGAFILIYLRYKETHKRNTRDKEEYGSARWAKPNEIKPYVDKEYKNNIILTATEFLTMNPRPKNPKYARNKNVLIVGGSGTGKTRFYMKPNIGQADADPNKSKYSFVITDPKGTLLEECGSFLLKMGYQVKVLNLKDSDSIRNASMKYNPFVYLKNEFDITTFVNTIIANTSGDSSSQAKEDFWVKSERLLYMALITYIVLECPKNEKNFFTLTSLVRACEVKEDDESYENEVDIIFKELKENGSWILREGEPEPVYIEGDKHFAVLQYDGFKLAAGKTAKSILISCIARLAPFDIQEVRELTSKEELGIDKVGDRKTALFLILSDSNKSLNFIASIMYTQMFNLLMNKADIEYGGRLPYHVRFMLDEFANIGKIPDFEILIATIRSREISVNIVLQTMADLKLNYKEVMDKITGNCDTFLFLGGKEEGTLKSLVTSLGKQTVDIKTTGESSGQSKSNSTNYQRLARDLMTADEIATMDNSKCILQIRGVRPFLSRKFPLEKHSSYKYFSDFNKANKLDVKEYLRKRREKEQEYREKAREKNSGKEREVTEQEQGNNSVLMPLDEAFSDISNMTLYSSEQKDYDYEEVVS